jgi:ArsR family transcriptional regulator
MSQLDLSQRAKVFNALSDPTRLQIVEALADGEERTTKEIADKLGITLALFCHHSNTLQQAGLLIKRKQGQSGYNRLDLGVLNQSLNSLKAD